MQLAMAQIEAAKSASVAALKVGGRNVGFWIGNVSPGPVVLVSGFEASATPTYERLLCLPSLRFLKGTLFLVYTDLLQDGDEDVVLSTGSAGHVDDVLFLPYLDSEAMEQAEGQAAINDTYWQILALCAKFGMISGRGIPIHRLFPPQQ